MFYGACLLVSGMGLLFIIRPYRIIKTIQALPVVIRGVRTLHLRIESASLFPGIRPRTVSVPASDISLSQKIHAEKYSGGSLSVLDRRRKQAERAQKLKEGNFMTLPFRQLGYHLRNGFSALKAVFTNNPFIYMSAKGYHKTWKLEVESGWALDEGRALDRLVKTN
ncbi:MAG: hypothetical protein Q9170_000446 [Blastenia crenularia]